MKLNKSQEELDNEKKWDGMSIFINCLALIWLGVLLISVVYTRGYKQGVASVKEMSSWSTTKWGVTPLKISSTTPKISILAEEKKCEEMGGEFWLNENNHYYPNNTKELDVTITCTSPAKELFKYEIK